MKGDVVLVGDKNLPRLLWKMARDTEIYLERDGKIKACEVTFPDKSTIRRPVFNYFII